MFKVFQRYLVKRSISSKNDQPELTTSIFYFFLQIWNENKHGNITLRTEGLRKKDLQAPFLRNIQDKLCNISNL